MLDFQAFPYKNKKKPKPIHFFYPKGNKNYFINLMKLLNERTNSIVRVGWQKSMPKPLLVLPGLPACPQKRLQAMLKEKYTT